MTYAVYTEGASNLPGRILKEYDIRVLPCSYTMDGEHLQYEGDIEAFDSHAYYDRLRAGARCLRRGADPGPERRL